MEGIRAHIGNGTVYLTDGYVNVDLLNSGSALAKDCPYGVAKWGTTSDNYYGHLKHIDELYLGKGTPDHETTVTDRYGDWNNLPFENNTVAELLSVQVFEHLSEKESRYALMEARRVMKNGGMLRLDMPDFEASFEEFVRLRIAGKHAHANFMKRHIFGSLKTDWAKHMGWWDRPKLIKFCAEYGFQLIAEEPNIHFYPAIAMRFQKLPYSELHPELNEEISPWQAAHQYCGNPLGTPLIVPDDWNVLEVGPGAAPWPRANAYCDVVPRDLPNFTERSVQSMTYGNKEFDFAFVSHVLEHVKNPVEAAGELSRVAKSGVVVCPTPFKEGLFLAHEQDHKWWVFAGENTLYFKRLPEDLYSRLYDPDLSSEMHRFWRLGERRVETVCNKALSHFHRIEPLTDVVFRWKNELKVQALE